MVAVMIFDQFMLATGLLTRLPVAAPETEETTVAEASWAFPAVGAGIGMITAAAFFAASTVGLGASPAALLAILVGVAVTGALHEDGLADTADGFGGGRDREQKLAIMRDSRHGTYAMLALIFSIGLRAGALVAIGSPIEAGLALIAANAASRGVLPVIMRGLAPAREDGLGAAAGTPGPAPMLVAMAIGIFVALGMLGPIRGAVALVLAGIAVAATAMLARRQIGGYTGDTLGACQQIGEIVMLLAAATR